MPRAEKALREARRFLHGSIQAAAEAVGVHRNTLREWGHEGCPLEKPVDELQVRIWAAARGYRCKCDPVPELAEQLAAAGVRGYAGADTAMDDEAALDLLPGRSQYDRAVRARQISYAEAEARERAIKLELANAATRREELERSGRLVPAARLAQLAGALRERLDQVAQGFGRRVLARCGEIERSLAAEVVTACDAEIADMLLALDGSASDAD